MKQLTGIGTLVIALGLVATFATPAGAGSDAPRERSEREKMFSRQEIDQAIAEAERSSAALRDAVHDIAANGKQDARKRADELREEVDELADAVARLRERFDEDADWAKQRDEARTAYTEWKELDPLLRHHWASKTRDELRAAHEDVRRLARIYEVDSPPRR